MPFGGIVAVNQPLDAAAAEAIVEVFTEVIIAPGADEAAQEIIGCKEESAPAADRRNAGSNPARPRLQIGLRRFARAIT